MWSAVAAAEDGVIGKADHRCECRGVCGRNHAKGGGRCDTEHRLGRPLFIVPADPETRLDTAAAVRASMVAMCGPCWDLAHKIATRQAAADRVADLPDLFSVDLELRMPGEAERDMIVGPADLGGEAA